MRGRFLDLNKVGIVGGVLALISLLLPWWEMNLSVWETTNKMVIAQAASIYIFPYQISSKNFPAPQTISIDITPFILSVMPFVVLGIILGIAGSVLGDGEKEKNLLISGGFFTLFSTIVFAFMLQSMLSELPPAPYFFLSYPGREPPYSLVPIPKVGLFSNSVSTFEAASINYSSYLSIGFWIAAIAAVTMLIASRRCMKEKP